MAAASGALVKVCRHAGRAAGCRSLSRGSLDRATRHRISYRMSVSEQGHAVCCWVESVGKVGTYDR